MTTKIAVLSDSDLFRAGLEAVVSDDPELLIRGRAGSTGALDLLEKVHPDVVILDYGADGAARLCKTLTRLYPTVPVLVVSTRSGNEALRSSVDGGARGFVYADVDRRALRSTITTLASMHPHSEATENRHRHQARTHLGVGAVAHSRRQTHDGAEGGGRVTLDSFEM